MPTFIVGLDRMGTGFYNHVMNYCHVTGHPRDPKIYKQIYDQCVSQIVNKMDSDFQVFMGNLMTLPCWDLIHYLPEPPQHDLIATFRDEFRSFAIWLWGEFNSKQLFQENYFFIFENASSTFVIVNAYVNADQI